MNLKPYFTSDYLFKVNSVSFQAQAADKAFLLIGLAFVLLAIVFKLGEAKADNPVDKKVRRKFFNLCLTFGLSETAWFGFRGQQINFFGSHFVAWLAVFACLGWLVVLIVKLIKNYRTDKTAWEKERVRMRYLPK